MSTYPLLWRPSILGYNAFLFRPSCHLLTKICWLLHSHSRPAPLEQTPASFATTIWPMLRTHQNLAVFPQLLHSKLITLLFNKTYPDSFSLPTSLPFSAPNTSTLQAQFSIYSARHNPNVWPGRDPSHIDPVDDLSWAGDSQDDNVLHGWAIKQMVCWLMSHRIITAPIDVYSI